MPIRTKRWNDPRDPGDGFRLLVCRYRPRGLRKAGPRSVALSFGSVHQIGETLEVWDVGGWGHEVVIFFQKLLANTSARPSRTRESKRSLPCTSTTLRLSLKMREGRLVPVRRRAPNRPLLLTASPR